MMMTDSEKWTYYYKQSKLVHRILDKAGVLSRKSCDGRYTKTNRVKFRIQSKALMNHIIFVANESDQALREFKAAIV